MQAVLRIAVGLIVVALISPAVWAADPAIVFVDEAKAGAKAIMVMDADGTNRREIFRTGKRFCDCGGPQLHPSISPDGEWVTYIFAEDAGWDIRKISVETGDSEVLLCGHRPAGNFVYESPQWSPDGKFIAAFLIDFFQPRAWIVVISADRLDECDSLPAEMYDVDSLGGEGPAWSPDGSQIAFLEYDDEGDYLTILDRNSPPNPPIVKSYRIVWLPELPEGHGPSLLDWQRQPGSLQFALSTYSDEAREEMVWLLTVDETDGTAIATQLAEGQSPTWSPDDSQLLFGGSQAYWGSGVLTRVTIATGGTEVLGPGYDPDWKRSTPECDGNNPCGTGNVCCGGSCVASACPYDNWCDDGDSCTINSCDPCTGCSSEPNPDCEPPPAKCSAYSDQQICRADSACRWHKKKGCVSR